MDDNNNNNNWKKKKQHFPLICLFLFSLSNKILLYYGGVALIGFKHCRHELRIHKGGVR